MNIEATDPPARGVNVQRLEFIEFRLFLGRSDKSLAKSRDRFSVSVPQASTDLSAYRAPGASEYGIQTLVRSGTSPRPQFKPQLIAPNAERLLGAAPRDFRWGDYASQIRPSRVCRMSALCPFPSRRLDPPNASYIPESGEVAALDQY